MVSFHGVGLSSRVGSYPVWAYLISCNLSFPKVSSPCICSVKHEISEIVFFGLDLLVVFENFGLLDREIN